MDNHPKMTGHFEKDPQQEARIALHKAMKERRSSNAITALKQPFAVALGLVLTVGGVTYGLKSLGSSPAPDTSIAQPENSTPDVSTNREEKSNTLDAGADSDIESNHEETIEVKDALNQ